MPVAGEVGAIRWPEAAQQDLNKAREVLEGEARRWRLEAREFQALRTRDEQRFEAAIHSQRVEIDRLLANRGEAEERLRAKDARVAGLASESQETLRYMNAVAANYDSQVALNATLQQRFADAELDAENLRAELREVFRGEAQRSEKMTASEVILAGVVPTLKEEMSCEETRCCRLESELHGNQGRAELTERRLRTEVRELQSHAQRSAVERQELGRRCSMSYEAVRHHEGAARWWHQRTELAERELVRLGMGSHQLWEQAGREHAENMARQHALVEVEAQRDNALQAKRSAEDAARDLRGWISGSLDEVSRSAHGPTDPFAPKAKDLHGAAWVDMLESFRQREQTRTGFGSRSRTAA